MEFDFEIVHRPEKYHKVADSMFQLPQKASGNEKKVVDVDDNIPLNCVFGQASKSNTVSSKYEDNVGPLSNTEEMMEAKANDMLCKNLKIVLTKHRTIFNT